MSYRPRYTSFDRRNRRELPMVNLRRLRRQFHQSQRSFARRYGFPVETLRHWEQGTRRPSKAALAYLNLISCKPLMVWRILDGIERPAGTGRFRWLAVNSRPPGLS